MAGPLVSVIIPTAGTRPRMLQRAVESALAGAIEGTLEVIVVPNGPAAGGRSAFASLMRLPGVHVSAIGPGNASAARNHGLALARGDVVRFLDDDDFLLPEVARRQYAELLDSPAAGSSYAIRIEDELGRRHDTLHQPVDADIIAGQLASRRLPLPLAHVYRRDALEGLSWNEQYRVAEDIAWLHSVLASSPRIWLRRDDVVGIWFQHSGPRLTYPHAAHEPNRITAESILVTVDTLARQGRATQAHRSAAAEGLWTCIHRAFPFHPRYWQQMARQARLLAPGLDRELRLYRGCFRGSLPPLMVEWLYLPVRLLAYSFRRLRGRLFGWSPVRNL